MQRTEALEREIKTLRQRLSRLIQASLRINESLDLQTVLQGVLDSARSLTDARYGVIATFDDSGQIDGFIASGLTGKETQLLWETTREKQFCTISGPRRSPGLHQLHPSAGNLRLPAPHGDKLSPGCPHAPPG